MLTLLIGGARSGKSETALAIARESHQPVVFIATGEPLDDEFAARIERHRSQRPKEWRTVEEPIDVDEALADISDDAIVIIDCLTLWVSNLFGRGLDDDAIIERASDLAAHARARSGSVVVVSNEVGMSIVPDNALSRRFRDCLGRVNAIFADRAATSFLVVAGRLLALGSPGTQLLNLDRSAAT